MQEQASIALSLVCYVFLICDARPDSDEAAADNDKGQVRCIEHVTLVSVVHPDK
jgi:hypothetical protein